MTINRQALILAFSKGIMKILFTANVVFFGPLGPFFIEKL